MRRLNTRDIIINADDYDAITNPKNPKNIAAASRAKDTFANISAGVNFNIVKPHSKKMNLRKRLERLNGTV